MTTGLSLDDLVNMYGRFPSPMSKHYRIRTRTRGLPLKSRETFLVYWHDMVSSVKARTIQMGEYRIECRNLLDKLGHHFLRGRAVGT